MAGEHILKLLIEENAKVVIDNGIIYMVVNFQIARMGKPEYTVYQRKPYARCARKLIQTQDEKEACRILKGE